MTATLVASPSSVATGATYSVSASGASDLRSRFTVNGTASGPTICSPADPQAQTFTAGAVGTETIGFEQYVSGAWTSAASSISVTVTAAPSGSTGGYPATRASGILSTSGGTTPSLPGYLSPITDATWGTKITRITNTASRRHNYAVIPVENADGTKLLMAWPPASQYAFLNASTYAVIRTTTTMLGYPSWSNVDPNKIWGTYSGDNHLYWQHPTTDAQTSVHTFTGYGGVSLGNGEGHVDDNDHYVALLTTSPSEILVYDILGNTVVANMALPGAADNATISRLGGYVIVNYSNDGSGAGQGVWKYTRNLTGGVNLSTNGGNHGDCGLDANGREIYVHISGAITSYDLATNAATTLLPSGTAFQSGHVSCRNTTRPGWAYLSVYDYAATAGLRGRDQLIAVKTDGSQQVEVFGYANSHHDGSNYASQPQASVSRDGRRMFFASTWGTNTNGTIYDYVAEAP